MCLYGSGSVSFVSERRTEVGRETARNCRAPDFYSEEALRPREIERPSWCAITGGLADSNHVLFTCSTM